MDAAELIYFDHAATSWPKPPEVAQEMARFLAEEGGNPGRSGHRLARAAGERVRETRLLLASALGIPEPERLVFTASCTEALNLAILGTLEPGERVLVDRLSHNAALRPLNWLAAERGVELGWLPCDALGRIDVGALEAELARRPAAMVCLSHASNVHGLIQPLAAIAAAARAGGARICVDAAQSAGVLPLDIGALGLDLVAAPGHKGLGGPTGVGMLYAAPGVEPRPLRFGGTGGDSAAPGMPASWPERHEAGTLNACAIAGLGAALRVRCSADISASLEREQALARRLIDGLLGLTSYELWCPLAAPGSEAIGLVSLRHSALPPEDLAAILDGSFGIATRAGLHCAPQAHEWLGTTPEGTVRVSFGPTNHEAQIDHLLHALQSLDDPAER